MSEANVETPEATATDAPVNTDAGASSTPEKTALTQVGSDLADPKKDLTTTDPTDGEAPQDKEDVKVEGAPQDYEDFTLPENMEVNQTVLDEFKAMAKEVNLPQDKAQKFVEVGAKLVQEAVENFSLAQYTEYQKKVESWHSQVVNDGELGGTEEKQKEVLSHARNVVSLLGGENLMAALDETGAGNHPEIIRAFYRLRDVVGEDGKLIQGNLGGSEPKTIAKTLYPNQT
jgi:hypothetical protein